MANLSLLTPANNALGSTKALSDVVDKLKDNPDGAIGLVLILLAFLTIKLFEKADERIRIGVFSAVFLLGVGVITMFFRTPAKPLITKVDKAPIDPKPEPAPKPGPSLVDCNELERSPKKPACFMWDRSRPDGDLMTRTYFDFTNACGEQYDWTYSLGQGGAYGNFSINKIGVIKPDETLHFTESPTNGEWRLYAKPSRCTSLSFPHQGSPEWNTNW
jgi:hypothetical protein